MNTEKQIYRSGSQSYAVDSQTNRYTAIASNSLTYDSAGNLTADKDGYQYQYDYENRIVKILDSLDSTVAQFAYDALGRRIRVIDFANTTTTHYYYNDSWQVLEEYTVSGFPLAENFARSYVYGNYIDEPLRMSTASNDYYYAQDHLYNVSALIDSAGDAVEYYEYDAYGNCHVLDSDFTADADGVSDFENPYLFTGRRLDILDNSSLKIQYSRHRYYHPNMGRFLTHDPLGITPNPTKPNYFEIKNQYKDGVNIYTYVEGKSFSKIDPYGLKREGRPCSDCYDERRLAMSKIAASAAKCHADCGTSDIGPSIALCLVACAKTKLPYAYPACALGCVGITQLPFLACHIACGKTEKENIANVNFAHKLCLENCCNKV